MKRCIWVLPGFILLLAGCGYRLAGTKTNSGAGRTIAVPTFTNRTTSYRIEQRMSEALRRELVQNTQFKVVPSSAGDVLVSGEVVSYFPSAILFNEQGRASSYTIAVVIKISIVDTKTGAVLLQNDQWPVREQFELARNSAEFVPEDPAALERLAKNFASSVVASLLNRIP